MQPAHTVRKDRCHRCIGLGKPPTRPAMAKCPQAIGHRIAHMPPEGRPEVTQPLPHIGIPRGLHFFEHIGVTANGALAKENEAAGENVRAFYGNAHGHLLVDHAQNILRPKTDAFATDNVHAVIHQCPGTFGHVVLGNGRDH